MSTWLTPLKRIPGLLPGLSFLLASLVVLALAYQVAAPNVIDVGSGSDAALIQGFSFRENIPPADAAARPGDLRWSSGRAEIRFWGLGAQEGSLRLRLAAPRPEGRGQVQVWANGHLLGTLEAGAGLEEFAFSVGRDAIGAGGDLIVTLVTEPFTAPPDTRELGAQVDWARFDSCSAPIALANCPGARALAPVIPSPRALYLAALLLLVLVASYLWTGSRRGALAAAALALALVVIALVFARPFALWFAAPLFWFGAMLLLATLLFARGLQALAPLTPRTLRALFAAMALGFAVRMVFAVGPGFIVDVQDYVVWSYKTVTYGLGTAYAAVNGLWIVDQSPGLVYLLHLMGVIYRSVLAPDFLYPAVAGDPALRALSTNPALLADPAKRTLLRMPSLFADLATGALIFAAARPRLSARGAWLLALGYWFNPAVLWNGAYWGQTDAVHSLLVLAAFLLMWRERIGWSFFVFGLAALTKPQALIYGPLLLLWAHRTAAAPSTLFKDGAGILSPRGLRGAVVAAACGGLGAGLMLAPMLLLGGVDGLLAYFADTVGHHPILSANAHNLWWLVQGGNIDIPDTRQVIPGVPLSYRALSLALFGLFYLAVLVKAWRASRDDYFALGASLGLAFFMLPTEIHENYGYALLPLLAVALAIDRRWALFYIGVTLTMVLNYALSDPPLFARFGLDNPDAQLAALRWWNSAANLALWIAWTAYLFGRGPGVARRADLAQGVTS